mgnify:CR=1 FL=1
MQSSPFYISKDFIDDLERQDLQQRIPRLRRALLVFHAPLDDVVSINEASDIFASARHPKSFVSLDGADHLLTSAADARYVAETTAAWVRHYLVAAEPAPGATVASGQVLVTEQNQRFLRGVRTDGHSWLADEPRAMGGDNRGPDPYEHLLAALGTCTSMTIRMYARRKDWPLEHIWVDVTHNKVHAQDAITPTSANIDLFRRRITVEGALSDEQRQKLLEIADKCPVHKTLEVSSRVETVMV